MPIRREGRFFYPRIRVKAKVIATDFLFRFGTGFALLPLNFKPKELPTLTQHEEIPMYLILLIILILLLLGGLPNWNYSRNWGYGPSGLVGLLVVILVVLLIFDVVHLRI